VTDVTDSVGLREALFGLPEQMAAAGRTLTVTGPLPDHDQIANVLVLGTGAAGWVGDLLSAVAGPFMPVPLVVHKGFAPPSFVDASTLVVAISASGNSPEAVSSATTSVEAGGRLLAVTSGGRLGALADERATPTVFLPASESPIPTRARIGALAVPVLRAFEDIGLFPGARDWIAAAIDQLLVRRHQLTTGADSLAEHLAGALHGTMPLVYGGGALGAVAAGRWKAQLNQSAKTPAWTGELPDVTHGEIAGWGQHGDITRQVLSLVCLRHDEEPPEVAEQFATVAAWTDEVVAAIHTVTAGGEGTLAQILDLGMVGDAVALSLAARSGIDPGPTPAIAGSPVPAATEAVSAEPVAPSH
jgi:glucose/mannose-6-phosphate isomerase